MTTRNEHTDQHGINIVQGGGKDRFSRTQLKPIARSVYAENKVVRLNGSFNGSIGSTGLHMGVLENSKGQMNHKFQQNMTQTFNISLLNNTFNQIPKPEFNLTTRIENSRSPRGVRSLNLESQAPFSVIPNAKIPDMSETRREDRDERVQNLLKRPRHKQGNKMDGQSSQQEKLMSAPLTMEDKGQFLNLPLINTLRSDQNSKDFQSTMLSNQNKTKGGDNDEETQEKQDNRALETVPNPPSFYDKDMDFWKNKFQKHIKEREFVKKMMAKTQNINCLTHNTNIKNENEIEGNGLSNRGKSLEPENMNKTEFCKPLFAKALKRRKSRQSNFGPGVIDFDYAGDSAQYQHLISERKDLGMPNKEQLNFEMKLRTYRNVTEFKANKAWCYPAIKEFSQKHQWTKRRRDTNLLNSEFKQKFNDKFEERNANELLHQFDQRGINSSAQWQCQLRNLEREEIKKEKSLAQKRYIEAKLAFSSSNRIDAKK